MVKGKGLLTALFCSTLGLVLATPENFLVIVAFEDRESLDPTFYDSPEDVAVVENMYEPLVQVDVDGNIQPVLATSWETSEDGLRYTFTLREGVGFHSGDPFTCADAEYSVRYQIIVGNNGFIPRITSSLAGLGFEYWDDSEDLIDGISYAAISEAVTCNEQGQLIFNLDEPNLDFLVNLTRIMVVDKAFTVTQGGWSGSEEDWRRWQNVTNESAVLVSASAGTGAYQLVSDDISSRSIFKAFENYWGGKPAIENVIVQYVPDPNTQLLALENDEADYLYKVAPNYAQQLVGTPGVVVNPVPSNSVEFFVFNQNIADPSRLGSAKLDGEGVPPDFFSDVHARRAFSYAFDDVFVINELYGGQGTPRHIPVPTFLLPEGFASSASTYSLERAEEEFKLAFGGQVWENGFTLELAFVPESSRPHYELVAEVLKARIEALNPKFRIRLTPYSPTDDDPYGDMIAKAPLFMDYQDFLPAAHSFFDRLLGPEGYYADIIADNEIKTLITRAGSEGDTENRQTLFEEIRDRLLENNYLMVLPERFVGVFYREELQGVTINPRREVGIVWKDVTK
jgi:peptide/nickel transport system substrate-binding protein